MTEDGPAPLGLASPQYKAKAELVYEEIRRAIKEGIFKPGDKLLTDQLASALRVSRMPVREAIKRLQVEGLVDVIPHKGATVATVTEEQMRDVFAVRVVVEGLAASLAAKLAEPQDVANLQALYKEMENLVASGDRQAQMAKNNEFHNAIFRISRNSIIKSLGPSLVDSIERYRLRSMLMPTRPKEVLEEHRRILDAIVRRDPAAAERAIRDHIERTGQLMASYVSNRANAE